MPIYEYRCGACDHYMDALQKISDAPLTDCPECNEAALKRLISAPSFRLKGSGWYETDFKSDKDRQRNLADKKESGEKKDSGDKKESGEKKESGNKNDAGTKSKESGKSDSKPSGGKQSSGTEAA